MRLVTILGTSLALVLFAAPSSQAQQPHPIQAPQPPPPGVVDNQAQPQALPLPPGQAGSPVMAEPGTLPPQAPVGPPPPPGSVSPGGLPPPPPGYGYSPGGYAVMPEGTPYRLRESPIRGYLGFSGVATFVAGQSGGPEYLSNGGGISLWGGFRFAEHFAIELAYTGSFHNPDLACVPGVFAQYCYGNYLVLDLLSMAGKYHFLEDIGLDPYIQVGAVLGWIGREGFRGDASGGGFHAGAGFDYWINPWVTIGTRILYWGVRMGDLAKRPGMDTFLSLVTGELAFGVHF